MPHAIQLAPPRLNHAANAAHGEFMIANHPQILRGPARTATMTAD